MQKGWKKVFALARAIKYVSSYTSIGYCPLIWRCHSRKINNQMNNWHECALRRLCNDKSSSFRELPERDKSVTIHERNVQVLLTEIFKAKSGVAPEIMTEIFKFQDHSYDLTKNNCIERRIIKSYKDGNKTVSNLGPKL